jgi:TolA-binding protein
MAGGRYADAAAAYAGLNSRFPDSAFAGRAMYLSAEALERAGESAAARERYLETAARYPHLDVASDSLLRVASIQAKSRELDLALDTYTRIVKSFTNSAVSARAYMGRGKVYYSKYQFNEAMQDFAAVAEVDPHRIDEARYFLILSLYGLGRDADALESAQTFVIDFPDSQYFPDMLLWLGKFHYNRANFADASKYFNGYASGFAGRKWADAALLWDARAKFKSGDFTTAIETIAEMVKRYPSSSRVSEARFVQAEALIELARFDAAILLLDGILENDPDSRWGHLALLRKGNCLFALGAGNRLRYEDALAVYQRMTEESGLTSAVLIELYYKIGRCLEKLERLDEAVDCYYSQVLLRYLKDRSSGTWYDESTQSLVVRASFSASEIFEKKGRHEQAVSVLRRIVNSGSAASDEALRRIAVLKKMHGS